MRWPVRCGFARVSCAWGFGCSSSASAVGRAARERLWRQVVAGGRMGRCSPVGWRVLRGLALRLAGVGGGHVHHPLLAGDER